MTSRHHHHSARKAAKIAGRAASHSAKCAESAALDLTRWGTVGLFMQQTFTPTAQK